MASSSTGPADSTQAIPPPDRTTPDLPQVSDIPDPTQPDDFTDIVLVVAGRRLYTCRGLLASASPVWRRMLFKDGFLEKDGREIPLPGKTFEDMLELLLCITPATQKPISGRCRPCS